MDGPERSSRWLEWGFEEEVDLRRYVDALRRNAALIALIVSGFVAIALAVSSALPETYRATARIVMERSTDPFFRTEVESLKRELATISALLTAPDVLSEAAKDLPGESRSSLADKVDASAAAETNIITIAATDDTPRGAAEIANAVGTVYLDQHERIQRERYRSAREDLEAQLAALQGLPGRQLEMQALREQIGELTVREASAGAELQLAQPALPPTAPSSPRPIRNALLAFFASLFIGIMVALGREQLAPRVGGPRQLSQLVDLPVLVALPSGGGPVSRRLKRTDVEHEIYYQTLQTVVRFQLPPGRQQILLVTSALQNEGKTEVTAALGRALAEAGEKVLLISADLRKPRLNAVYGVPAAPGLGEILAAAELDFTRAGPMIAEAVREPRSKGSENGRLHVLPSGRKQPNAVQLLSGGALGVVFEAIRQLDYTYVLVDAAPLLGIAHSQVLAHEADGLLVVANLERLRHEEVTDLRELLHRLDVNTLGVVVLGARERVSPYYFSGHTAVFEEAIARRRQPS